MNLEPIDTSTTAGKARVRFLAEMGRKRVAVRLRNVEDRFSVCSFVSWNWETYDYAIIAETVGPHVVWATVIDGGVVMDVYATEQEADAALNRGWEKVKYIRADLAGEKG